MVYIEIAKAPITLLNTYHYYMLLKKIPRIRRLLITYITIHNTSEHVTGNNFENYTKYINVDIYSLHI